MNQILPMASISDMRQRHLELFQRLESGPVVIANRNQPEAVLVAPEQWNALAEELEDLRDLITGLNAQLQLERGEEEISEIDPEKLARWAGHAVAG